MNTQTQQQITSIVEGMLREDREYTMDEIKARVKLQTGGFTVPDHVVHNINERVEAGRQQEASSGLSGYEEADRTLIVMSELMKQRPSLNERGIIDLMGAKGIRVSQGDVAQARELMYQRGQGVGGVNFTQETQLDAAEEACELLGALDQHLQAQHQAAQQAAHQEFQEGAHARGMDDDEYFDAQLVEAGRMSPQQFQRQHNKNVDGSELTEVQQANLM